MTGKIIMQKLWLLKLGWDEPVPTKERTEWLTFRSQLPELEKIRIPRWTGTYTHSIWNLHGFCDASERAYAALVYVTVSGPPGSPAKTKLLTAKAKVAPIQVVSLPRLELCGALLLSRLVSYVVSNIGTQHEQVHCWTDSNIVLAWLQRHPSRWKTFVANRVSENSSSVPNANWRHVCSGENPADLASRGVTPDQLLNSKLWWNGPEWLEKPQSAWPSTTEVFDIDINKKRAEASASCSQSTDLLDWFSRFSSVEKLIRILAWIYRWKTNAKKRTTERRYNFLSVPELQAGSCYLFKADQAFYFAPEIEALKTKSKIPRSSALARLDSFLDQEGLIRVGGRLQNSHLSFAKNHITRLLIQQAHLDTSHGGAILVQSHFGRRYWIIRGRNVIRLPSVRVTPTRPFTAVGLDYAGPFLVKASPGRGQKVRKSYVAIFVCMVVRAVHIEVVSDLTSSAFLAAFRRFVARRGKPSIVFSDNGTTFKGTDALLKNLFAETAEFSKEVAARIARDGVQWIFIPPRAPNFGGLWETTVRSFKKHLYRVIGETKLTYEEFNTVAATIEACLNSGPLSAYSVDTDDLSVLTPGHFLIGAEIVAPPEPFEETNEAPSACARWHLLTLIRNHFWKRWSRECFHQMQQRSKWLYPNQDMQIGDLILFKVELLPPTKWPLARIVHLYHGPDGLSRVARIKTATKIYTRPINKLVKLPINKRAESHLITVNKVMAGGDLL